MTRWPICGERSACSATPCRQSTDQAVDGLHSTGPPNTTARRQWRQALNREFRGDAGAIQTDRVDPGTSRVASADLVGPVTPTVSRRSLGWMATMAGVGESYASVIAPFVLARSGIALVFAPAANAVLSSVRTDQAGQGSGATNAIRELGGVRGGAGHRVHQPRRLRLRPVVRRWAHPGDVGRYRRAWCRCRDRGDAAVQHPGGGHGAGQDPKPPPARTQAEDAPIAPRHKISDVLNMASAPTPSQNKTPRPRVPASERREALIEAAVHEFAQTGLHGTPVDRIARRVGVAQPYVFSLFARDLYSTSDSPRQMAGASCCRTAARTRADRGNRLGRAAPQHARTCVSHQSV